MITLGSLALQAGGCSLRLLRDSRGAAALQHPTTRSRRRGGEQNWRRLQQGAGDGGVMARPGHVAQGRDMDAEHIRTGREKGVNAVW